MGAEIKPNVDENRKKLAEIVPLEHPFTVYIEPTRICNMKCFYCIHSTRNDDDGEFKKLNYAVKNMPIGDFQSVIQQLLTFPTGSIKRIVFSGLGEPLANPLLPEFIRLAKESGISERVEVITNGLLLNEKRSRSLIDAGVTNINVSVQGVNGRQYAQTCGVEIDFDGFLNELKYLYKIRDNTKIYIKIIDVALEKKEDEKMFYSLFSCCADKIFVEHLVQMQQQHDRIKDQVTPAINMYGRVCNTERKVCGQCFYFLQIGCDLDVFPCSIPGLRKGFAVGNMKRTPLKKIWNGKKRTAFLRTMLKLQKDKYPECRTCLCYNVVDGDEEYLDDDADRLLKYFE